MFTIVFEKIKKLRADLFFILFMLTINLEIAMIEIEPLIKPRKDMKILNIKKKKKSIFFHTKKIHSLLHLCRMCVNIKKGMQFQGII